MSTADVVSVKHSGVTIVLVRTKETERDNITLQTLEGANKLLDHNAQTLAQCCL